MAKQLHNELLSQAEAISNIGIWELDLTNNNLYWSDGVFKICGYEPQEFEVTYEKGLSVIHPDDKTLVIDHIQNSIATGQPYEVTIKIITKDNSIKYVNSKARLIRNEDGIPLKLYGVYQDITDKKESEIERIKLNQEAIINSSTDLIWSIDSEMRLITSNKAYNKTILEFTGRIVEEGDNILMDEYDKETVNKWRGYYERGLKGESFSIKYHEQLIDQSYYNLISFSPMFTADGEVWGLACNSKNITEETINLIQLEKTKEELQKIMNSSLDVICTFNKNNEFVKVNAASEWVWGYKPEELIGRNYDFLVHPDDLNLTDTTTNEIQGGVNVLNFENRNIKKDGTIIPMLWSANYDEKEEITYCVAKDVSAIKKTEGKLRLSEQYFKNLIQNGGDLVGILNTEGDYLYVSPNSHSILGILSEELIGKNCFSFMHPDDKNNIESNFIKLATLQKVQFEPFRFKHNDGSWLWIEAIGTNLLDDEAINGIVINARDITDKIKKDNILESTNKILKNAQKITKMGNWEYNLTTDELFWSDEIYEIFEIKKDVNKRMSFSDFASFIHPDDILKVIHAKDAIVATGEILDVQHRVITKNQKEKFVKELAEKIFDKETNSFWLLGTIRDNTEAILNQKRIEASEKKYKYLFDNNPSAMFIFDFETLKIVDCNQEALELYEYTKEQFLNLTIKDIRPEEDIDLINKATKNEEVYGEIHKDTWRHKKKNGVLMYVQINGHLIDYEGRRCSLVLVTDITEKLKVENAIKASEQQKELIMNAALDAIICINKKGDVTFWNPQAEKIFDWKSNEVIGENLSQLIVPHQHRSAHNAGMKHYLKSNEGPVLNKLLELSALNRSGKEFPIELTVIPIKQGDTEFFCAFIRDISQRKKVEKEILESNQRYNYATKATSDAIWDLDLTTDTIYWGEGLSNIFGYHLDSNISNIEFWKKNIHPDDLERVSNSINQAIINKDSQLNWIEEYRFLKSDGNYAFVQDKGIVVKDETGVATRMVGAMQDITKKKEEDLRLKLLESVVTNTNDAVLITEAEPFGEQGPRILYVNEAFSKMTGYTPDEVIGKTPRILQGPNSDKAELKKLSDALRNWKSCTITTINYKKNGDEFYINFSVTPVADSKGWFTHWIAIERDVTESVIAQQKLIASYNERNTILESIDDGFFAIDNNSLVTYWNKKAEILLNANKEEVLGKNLHEMFANPNSMAFHNHYQKAINENRTVHFEEFSVRSNKWFEVSAFASDKGLSVYFKDATVKKQSEAKLLELNQKLLKQTRELSISNQELEQFAYVASHDLQEPLRMITSFLALIEKKYNDVLDEKGKQYIYFAVDGAKRMRQIILDLLEFSRIGRDDLNLEEIDLNDVISEIQLLYRKQIEEVSAKIITNDLPKIISFKTPIRQILQNLISNALKYHTKGISTEINLGFEDKDNYWQFYVKDNGIGINDEYFQKIFIIFQRLHNKDEYSGTGIGLAICKKIIENLGGKIWVEANKNQGSCFYFTIPKTKI